jgi:hypothetical protein
MAIPVFKITVAIKKSSVRREYPGGIPGFRNDYPDATEDGYIFGLARTTDSEIIEVLQQIGNAGISLIESCTVGDQHLGPIERHPHFDYSTTDSRSERGWDVRLIDDDSRVLAEDGSHLQRHFIREGWSMSIEMEGEHQ